MCIKHLSWTSQQHKLKKVFSLVEIQEKNFEAEDLEKVLKLKVALMASSVVSGAPKKVP